jgi:hypothetical protein
MHDTELPGTKSTITGPHPHGYLPREQDGTRLWGDIFGYQTLCWTTEDGRRQLTVAATPWGAGNLDELLDTLVTTAFASSR